MTARKPLVIGADGKVQQVQSGDSLVDGGGGPIGGGASATGTGFMHFVAGVQDAAAKLVETTDFAANVVDTDGTLAANSDTRIATQKAVKTYAQPLDADLTSWAAVTRAAGFDTFATTPSSDNLRSLLSDETGTGLAYFQGGDIGTPSAGVATNLTGTASGLTAGTVTTNANLTGPITSVGNATTIADAELAAIAGLTSAADKGIMFTGAGTAATYTLSAAALTVLDDATVAAMVDTLGGASSTGTGGLVRKDGAAITGSWTGVALALTGALSAQTFTASKGGTNNEAYGSGAGGALTVGSSQNTLVGLSAGNAMSTGTNNTILGALAASSNYNASGITAIGVECFKTTTIGTQTGLGYQAGLAVTTGARNTLIGYQCAKAATILADVTAIGYDVLTAATSGSQTKNVWIGTTVANAFTTQAPAQNVGIGYDVNSAATFAGTYLVSIGYQAGKAVTTANNCVLIGQQAGTALTGSSDVIAIGRLAGSSSSAVGGSVYIGVSAGAGTQSGNPSVMIGQNAGSGGTAGYNVIIGDNAVTAASAGSDLVAIGRQAGQNSTVSNCVFIGDTAGDNITSANGQNVAIGVNAMHTSSATGCQRSVAIGYGAMGGSTSGPTGSDVFIGYLAGNKMTGSNCVGIGTGALQNTTGGQNTGVGDSVLATAGSYTKCTGVGYLCLTANTATGSTAMGWGAAQTISSGVGICAFGLEALKLTTDGTNHAFGYTAGKNLSTGARNSFFGYTTGTAMTVGTDNSFFGNDLFTAASSGTNTYNVAMGSVIANAYTTSSAVLRNVLIGYDICTSASFASADGIFIGYQAGKATTSGAGSVGVGSAALTTLTSGTGNTACGMNALHNQSTGSYCIGLGYNTGYTATGSNTLYIGDVTQHASTFAINDITIGSSQAYGPKVSNPMTFSDRVYINVPNSAPTDGNLQNSTVTAYVDQTAHNLLFRVKYSDGTLKLGTVALV